MSKLADSIYVVLRELFPHSVILKEEYVFYLGVRLYFDFYIKDIGMFVEVQGRQHTKFTKHFHGKIRNFIKQQYRDDLKKLYVNEDIKLSLVRFNYNEKITVQSVKHKIFESLKRGFYE